MKFNHLVLALAVVGKASAGSDDYDAIIVGAGAGGCPLAQTLAEGGLKTLLIERGKERADIPTTLNKATFGRVLRSECIESFSSNGVVVSTGNCMGGATSVNQGIFIEETGKWFEDNVEIDGTSMISDTIFREDLVRDAYTWVREQVAPEATTQTTPEAQVYTDELIESMKREGLVEATNYVEAVVPEYGIWRPSSIFDNISGDRRSADTLLDRSNPNLEIMSQKEVEKIAFSQKGGSQNPVYTATCVEFADGTVDACVKKGGRIYLSSGAFNTPKLLMKSGIGEDGAIVDNPQVGKNLSDKPLSTAATFFKPVFNYNEITLADVAANKKYTTTSGDERTLLWEDSSAGNGEVFDVLLYEKFFTSLSLRDTQVADIFIQTADCCAALLNGLPSQSCVGLDQFGFVPPTSPTALGSCTDLGNLAGSGCLNDVSFLAYLVADPTSTGRLTLDASGNLEIDVNYLDDIADLEAFGEAARVAHGIKIGMTGDSAPDDQICPVAYQAFADATYDAFATAFGLSPNPFSGVPSIVQPNLLQAFLAIQASNSAIANAVKANFLISPHHFAGTARIGDVINDKLKVKGVNGLYVADASALPKTPRVNTMPTVMMLGRLAALDYLEEKNAGRQRLLRKRVDGEDV